MKARLREQAFALFLEGKSLREIARVLQVARVTVERWSTKGGWVVMRNINETEARRRAAEIIRQESGRVAAENLDDVDRLVIEASAEMRAVLSGEIPISRRKFTLRDLCTLILSHHAIGLMHQAGGNAEEVLKTVESVMKPIQTRRRKEDDAPPPRRDQEAQNTKSEDGSGSASGLAKEERKRFKSWEWRDPQSNPAIAI